MHASVSSQYDGPEHSAYLGEGGAPYSPGAQGHRLVSSWLTSLVAQQAQLVRAPCPCGPPSYPIPLTQGWVQKANRVFPWRRATALHLLPLQLLPSPHWQLLLRLESPCGESCVRSHGKHEPNQIIMKYLRVHVSNFSSSLFSSVSFLTPSSSSSPLSSLEPSSTRISSWS